jgi:hypothetical protein
MFEKKLTYDALHPGNEGYTLIEPLAQAALDEALTSSKAVR